jgi:hypothetical protein
MEQNAEAKKGPVSERDSMEYDELLEYHERPCPPIERGLVRPTR